MTIGLIYSLIYGLAAWGPDAWILARSHAELAWGKLLLGLPLALIIGAGAGRLAARRGQPGAWVGAWMAGGVLTGAVVGLVPYVGMTATTWVVEPRLLGANVYPIGSAGVRRLAFVAVFNGCVGSVAGLAGHLLAERTGGSGSPDDGADRSSWPLVLLYLLLAVLPARVGDEIANRPLRAGQRAVHNAIATGPVDPTNIDEMTRYRALAGGGYTLHRLGHDLETLEAQTIDVAFADHIAVRCQVSGQELGRCLPISPAYEAWMDALIRDGRGEGDGMELSTQAGTASVSQDVWRWLDTQQGALGGRYQISSDAQRGDRVIMAARFDTGYVLNCYFRGVAPVVLDRCNGSQAAQRSP